MGSPVSQFCVDLRKRWMRNRVVTRLSLILDAEYAAVNEGRCPQPMHLTQAVQPNRFNGIFRFSVPDGWRQPQQSNRYQRSTPMNPRLKISATARPQIDPFKSMIDKNSEPPVEEPPSPSNEPPIEEPEKPPSGPFPPRRPPVQEPPDSPQRSPIKEPPPEDPDRPPHPPQKRVAGRFVVRPMATPLPNPDYRSGRCPRPYSGPRV